MYSKATWVLLSSGTQVLPQKILNPDYLSFPFLKTMFVISNINGKSWLVGIYPFIMALRKLCWNAISHRNFPLILSKISSLFLGSFFSNVLSSTQYRWWRSLIPVPKDERLWKHMMFGAIWYRLYRLKACNFTKSSIPPWVVFTFLKLYKYYQITQRITIFD